MTAKMMKAYGTLCLFVFYALFTSALSVEYFCDYVITGQHLVLVSPNTPKGVQYFKVYGKSNVEHDVCRIIDGHSLRIEFKRVSQVSDVMIRSTVGANLNTISVSLWRGSDSFECKISKGVAPSAFTDKERYATFLCYENGVYKPSGLFANGIEIKSVRRERIDLGNLKTEGSYGWLLLVRKSTEDTNNPGKCEAPVLTPGQRMLSPAKNIYKAGEAVNFACEDGFGIEPADYQQTCHKSGHWLPRQLPLCQPSQEAETWYGTSLVTAKSRKFSPKMKDVSLVVPFKRDFHNIAQVDIIFKLPVQEVEATRPLGDNMIYRFINANNDVIYEYRLGKADKRTEVGKNGITTTFPKAIPYCSLCTVKITFSTYSWDSNIVQKVSIYGSAANIKLEHPSCPPIEPYSGMPKQFLDYGPVADGTINELILKTPCRDGYRLVGNAKDIYQCINGTWIGKGFPVCEEIIRSTSPPTVENAIWHYANNETFSQVVYVCQHGYEMIGSASASYNAEEDTWTTVPYCERVDQLSLAQQNVLMHNIGLVLGVVGLAIAIAIVVWYKCCRNRNRKSDRQVKTEVPVEAPASTLGDNVSVTHSDFYYYYVPQDLKKLPAPPKASEIINVSIHEVPQEASSGSGIEKHPDEVTSSKEAPSTGTSAKVSSK